jgi:hypothetical protein
MRRFDLLDEYTCVAAPPRRAPARDRSVEHQDGDGDGDGQTGAAREWRYALTGIIAALAIAMFAL